MIVMKERDCEQMLQTGRRIEEEHEDRRLQAGRAMKERDMSR
jgi:hypothetical protein